MTSILGVTESEEARHEGARSSIRAELVRRFALGGGLSVGAVIIFGVIELLRADPHEAFPLLTSWGPKGIGSIILIYVVYDLAKMLLNFGARLIQALEKMAIAQERSSAKDDRQVQEMQTLTSYTAQQSEKIHGMMMQLGDAMGKIDTKLDDMKRTKGSE
jgi:hypothetical protein